MDEVKDMKVFYEKDTDTYKMYATSATWEQVEMDITKDWFIRKYFMMEVIIDKLKQITEWLAEIKDEEFIPQKANLKSSSDDPVKKERLEKALKVARERYAVDTKTMVNNEYNDKMKLLKQFEFTRDSLKEQMTDTPERFTFISSNYDEYLTKYKKAFADKKIPWLEE